MNMNENQEHQTNHKTEVKDEKLIGIFSLFTALNQRVDQ